MQSDNTFSIFYSIIAELKTTKSQCKLGCKMMEHCEKWEQRLWIKAWIQQLWLDLGIDPCRFAARQSSGVSAWLYTFHCVQRPCCAFTSPLCGSLSGLKDTALSAATAAHRSHSSRIHADFWYWQKHVFRIIFLICIKCIFPEVWTIIYSVGYELRLQRRTGFRGQWLGQLCPSRLLAHWTWRNYTCVQKAKISFICDLKVIPIKS